MTNTSDEALKDLDLDTVIDVNGKPNKITETASGKRFLEPDMSYWTTDDID